MVLWLSGCSSFRALGFQGFRFLRALGGLGLYGIRVLEFLAFRAVWFCRSTRLGISGF